ncbi:carboxypeptidase M32 [Candidatus Epulonipiscium viviparus]|uniref:carboxypeptidase M32 n=1 Tax=Candidatus Epulonipiscium viviparus TaxID=420336 RepID=UPI00273810E6|nr:carboxypeptidase M32 [Candidatus Epulopiscium viviparus]
MELLTEFKEHLKEIENLNHANAILYWDMQTVMPKNGIEAHIDSMTQLSNQSFKLWTSKATDEFLTKLAEPTNMSQLDDISKVMVKKLKEDFDRDKNIPPELVKRRTIVTSKSENEWKTAKYANDFETMIPYFEEIISIAKETASYTNPGEDPYDALLDHFEKGMDKEKIAKIFSQLRDGTVPLIEEIAKRAKFDDTRFNGEFQKIDQQKFANYLMNVIGYDLDSGVLGETEHPFSSGNAPFDVRITTHYHKEDIRPSAFSILHEGGHAIYEQHINKDLVGTTLNSGTSMGIHESQSRFYENIIGRNKNFWNIHYSKLQECFSQYQNISVDDFYKGINSVFPSLIRIEADELTYNMHVIIRFELEKALFDGTLAVKDLPTAWRDKMKAYLGVEPANNKEGVLQDVHWPAGLFGYFPSYTLGNIYGGQFLERLEKELGSIDDILVNNEISKITQWLTKNIHQYGKTKTPAEIIKDTCGATVDAAPIIKYYTTKYSQLYNL